MDSKHKYSTENIVVSVSLLWKYDIRIYFVNIFTEVQVPCHGCSVLHVLTWGWGSLRLFAISSTNLNLPPFLNKGAATTQQM